MTRRIPYVRILGYGSGAYSYAFVTERPGILPASGWSVGTTLPVLISAPKAFGVKLEALQRVGAASDVTFDLLFDGTVGGAEVGGLLASDALPLSDGAGGYVKTSRYETHTSTTIAVHDSGSISTDDYVWVQGEVMRVTGTTSTTLTVTRGQRDTWARPIQYNRIASGTPVYANAPTVYGLAVEVGYIDGTASAGTVVWRGFVQSVTVVNGTIARVKARSLVGYLKDVDIVTPPAAEVRAMETLNIIDGEVFNNVESRRFLVDADLFGDPAVHATTEWDYVRIYNDDDEWVTLACTHNETAEDINGRRFAYYDVTFDSIDDALQGGTGSTVVYFDNDRDGDRDDFVRRVLRGAVRAEYTSQLTGNIIPIVNAFLQTNAVAGTSAMLPSAWVSASNLYRGASVLALGNAWDTTSHYVPTYDGAVLDALGKLYLNPIFIGLAEDAGQLCLVDWVPPISRGADVTLTGDDAVGAGYTLQLRATEAVPAIRYEERRETRGTLEISTGMPSILGGEIYYTEETQESRYAYIISELGVLTNAWTDVETVEVIGYSGGGWLSVLGRGAEVVDVYDRSLPTLALTCQPTSQVTAARVGDIVSVSRADLPTASGVRGVSTVRGIITERSVDTLTGETSIVIVLTDWYASQLARGVWGPCAEITAWNGGTGVATIAANAYSASTAGGDLPTSDAEAWETVFDAGKNATMNVTLIDNTGNIRDSCKLAAVTPATPSLTLGSLSVTPAAGDRIILRDIAAGVSDGLLTTTITIAPIAFLADSSGDVNGGTVAGKVYS